jgi:hypothetical protein
MSASHSASSRRQLLSADPGAGSRNDGPSPYGEFYRASSAVSTSDINFPKVIDKSDDVGEQTLYQVEITNDKLLRKTYRSELAAKKKCLTRRWQTALAIGVVLGALIAGICKSTFFIYFLKFYVIYIQRWSCLLVICSKSHNTTIFTLG